MKRRPKWWNIDWVELGCRGWDITVKGAGLGEGGELDWQYAHLDRDTLDLILHGKPAFVARVLSDLVEAKVFRVGKETNTWNMAMNVGGFGVNSPTTSDNTMACSGYWIKLVA